jgi:hypothetical protein
MRKITSLILCWALTVLISSIGNGLGAVEPVDDKLDFSAITIEKGKQMTGNRNPINR